ncbi:hypothetical protein G9A89_012615 [Geosiphon pyriformis]|nr:hypothetical protein G9A89_012615 [Geosiphon pyriformis]
METMAHDLGNLLEETAMYNIWDINVSAKQKDVVHWYKDMNNLILIITETKLKNKVCPWIAGKFKGIHIFTSGLDSEYLGVGVVIIMNFFLAKHVYKVSEMSGQLLSIRLLFKNKLSVSVLGFYASALSVVWFLQTSKINFLIAKTVNESFFIILGGDFNEDDLQKCTSFKKCINLALVNSLVSSLIIKSPT